MGVHSQPGQLSQPGNLLMQQPLLQQTPWTYDTVWQQHKLNFAMIHAGWSVSERCAGACTPSLGMQLLHDERAPRLFGAWDLVSHLEGIFRQVHDQ